ncbi:MAG TPA: hypothetical protein VNL38_02900 [Candidatus Nitrosotenuis sp.]|nr:hypothetical protein [Candidatus Nitrosotenuis sp.]
MAARKCPNCLSKISAGVAAAFTDGLECPDCQKQLEVSVGSRYLSVCAGIVAGLLAWQMSRAHGLWGVTLPGTQGGELAFVLPVVYVFLAFSVVTPLALMLIADLRLKPDAPPAEPLPAGNAHAHH